MMPPLFLVLLIAFASATAAAPLPTARALDDDARGYGHRLKSKTFLSPPFSLRPGSVSNKWYMDVDFPRGHLALKSFNGEVVDARGAPVPLHETYLHHWLVEPYYSAARGGVEYTVEECSSENRARNDCVDMKVTKEVLPRGGDIVFAVGHQHSGGIGTSLHGQDGRLLCSSTPIYGDGEEAGDEAGYVVGMSACYPEPGAAKVRDGEALTVVSNYTGERRRTGVMGHFYLLVADEQEGRQQQQPAPNKQPSASWCVPAWLLGNLQ